MDPARELTRDDTTGGAPRHLTTRRGVVATLSLAGVSLYGLWAAYGAAPLTFGRGPHDPAPHAGGHGGHGAAAGGPSPEEFRRLVDEFIARHQLPDGSVAPDATTAATEQQTAAGHDAHGPGALAHPARSIRPPRRPRPTSPCGSGSSSRRCCACARACPTAFA